MYKYVEAARFTQTFPYLLVTHQTKAIAASHGKNIPTVAFSDDH